MTGDPPTPQAAGPRRFAGERVWPLVALACALLHLGLAVRAAWLLTPTVDEFAHVPAGAAYWRHGRLDLYAKNPPLWKLWIAAPVVADSRTAIPPLDATPEQLRADAWAPWRYGIAFMNANRPHYFELFIAARLASLVAVPLCGLLIFRLAGRLFGAAPAGIATALFFLSPSVLAHGSLATLDAGCMLGMLVALITFRAALRRRSAPSWLLAGLAWGLSLLIKFTPVLLLPAFVLLAAIRAGAEPREHRSRALARDAAGLGLCLVAALLVINVGMGFGGSFRRLDAYVRNGGGESLFVSSFARTLQAGLPGFVPVPLPSAYLLGFDAQKRDTETSEFGASYLMGEWSATGWWYYDLVALAVKEPLPALLLVLLGAGVLWRSGAARADQCFIGVSLGVLLVMLCGFNQLDIGVRYLLPVFPLLFLLVAAALRWLTGHAHRAGHAVAAIAVGSGLLGAVSSSPDHLAWFNRIAGGPARGADWLLDSNLDWGQDLYRVARWVETEGIEEPIGLLYFGHVDPALYGLRYELVPDRPVRARLAVSVNYARGQPYAITLPDGRIVPVRPDHLRWLEGSEPVRRLGSILVFDTRR
jgi:hypothetical protein